MKNKKLITILAAVLILVLGVGIGAYAASSFGTQSDPLVAKSYLDNVLTPSLQKQFETQLSSELATMDNKIANVASTVKGGFSAVSLAEGESLTTTVGSELILRSGSASAIGSLTDVTEGTSVSGEEALTANHLCVVGTDGSGVLASEEVTLLIRGSYNIEGEQ